MTRDEVAAAYAALPALPDGKGEPTWCELLASFDAFMASGPDLAEYFRMMTREFGDSGVDRAFRQTAPEWFDLLMRAFPPPS